MTEIASKEQGFLDMHGKSACESSWLRTSGKNGSFDDTVWVWNSILDIDTRESRESFTGRKDTSLKIRHAYLYFLAD